MDIRFLRALDGIFHSMLAFIGLMFYEQSGFVIPHRSPTLYTALPLAGILIATLHLGGGRKLPEEMLWPIINLRRLSIALLAFYPFIPWHAHGVRSVYLTAGAGICMVLGSLYISELLKLMDVIFMLKNRSILRKACLQLRMATTYLVLTPAATIYVMIIYNMRIQDVTPTRLFFYAWTSIFPLLRTVIIAAFAVYVCIFLFLIRQSRICVSASLEKNGIPKL